MQGHAEREHIVFQNYEWIRDVCSRLPAHTALFWDLDAGPGTWQYMKEAGVSEDALHRGTDGDLNRVLGQRRRGTRLVVIVGHGGILYEFV